MINLISPPLFDRLTLFFDFLGTSEATRWPPEKLYPFLDLLISIASIQSEQNIEGDSRADGSYVLRVTPEITTFSDNVVVSYPSAGDETSIPRDLPKKSRSQFEALWAKIACQDAIRILSGVAEAALRMGVLVRGGFTYGQLHHDRGVVFGEAMVDAILLEKKEAIYPRVLVSERIVERLDQQAERPFLLRDFDGRWHLNYIGEMIPNASRGVIDDTQPLRWKQAHTATIDAAIQGLRSDPHRMSKWVWFKAAFDHACDTNLAASPSGGAATHNTGHAETP